MHYYYYSKIRFYQKVKLSMSFDHPAFQMLKQLNIVSANVLDHAMIQFHITDATMCSFEIITGLFHLIIILFLYILHFLKNIKLQV